MSSVGPLLLALDEANKRLLTDITRMKHKINNEDFKLARTDQQRADLKSELDNLYKVARQIQVSAGFVAKGCEAALKLKKSEGDLKLQHQEAADTAYDNAMQAHRKALRILSGSAEVPAPSKEPAQMPAAVPTPPAPKADEPKGDQSNGDKKVAGAPPVLTSAPWPTWDKGEGKEPRKPAEPTPSPKKESQQPDDVLGTIKAAFDEQFARLGKQLNETDQRVTSVETRTGELETTLEELATAAEPYTKVLTRYTPEQVQAVMDYVLGKLDGQAKRNALRERFLVELPDPRKSLRRGNSAGPTTK